MSPGTKEITLLRARVAELEAQLLAREQAARELTALYDAQAAYLERHVTSWCFTPFALRIAELEGQSKTPVRGLEI